LVPYGTRHNDKTNNSQINRASVITTTKTIVLEKKNDISVVADKVLRYRIIIHRRMTYRFFFTAMFFATRRIELKNHKNVNIKK
jgi:hypothetical protein